LSGVDAARIEQLNDSFTLAGQAVQELAGRLLSQLQPSLQAGAERFVRFVARFDISAAARAVESALADVVAVLGVLGQIAGPLARNIFPAIGGYLAFINRQAIALAATQIAQTLGAAAAAALSYAGAARQAAAATAVLGTSIRGFLLSTGVGALVVGFGIAAGAVIDWGLGGQAAGVQVQDAVQGALPAIREARSGFDAAALAAENFGEEAARAIKVPKEITANEFAQGSLDEARSAIVSLGRELGGLDRVPQEILQAFAEISKYAGEITDRVQNQAQAIQIVDADSRKVVETVRQITEARRAEADATKNAADEARRAAEDASRDARRRVQGLVESGLPEAERSRLQLSEDLLAISRTIADAEAALQQAKQAGDARAVAQAEERLRLTKETAAAATEAARQAARDRELVSLGIDQSLLQPAKTLQDQVAALRQAFGRGLIDDTQARRAVSGLAAEGVNIRRSLAAELARPAARANAVADIRTQEGAASFVAMATGRSDPAIEQMRAQLQKLDEIKRVLEANGIRVADILGAA
jgi:hypothetical protein